MSSKPRIVVIGAGPTGIGAAWRLNELGHRDWVLCEAAPNAGGLASSVVDDQGFVWDLGGHVLFSHYKYFDRLMEKALGEAWVQHVREAWVWIRDRWIPYPFQNNIWRLPDEDLIPCLEGLVENLRDAHPGRPESFEQWLLQSFGRGICDTFMFPYNQKVWAYHPRQMDTGWMGERVAQVDLMRILSNLVLKQDDLGWGPNSTFSFPLRGGTGAIWKSLCAQLPQDRLRFEHRLTSLNMKKRVVRFEGGRSIGYDYLISTIPLDLLLRSIPDRPDLADRASEFVYSSSHIIGVGFTGQPPESLKTKCWMYFPEPHLPFYRVTVFSNYSVYNVPRPKQQWSLMAEVSESPCKSVNYNTVVEDTISGFKAARLINRGEPIVTKWHCRLKRGYPTPWLGRDEVLDPLDQALRAEGIFSRGRFGAWKYEVSNQDHSVMQGVEAVNHILNGEDERTYYGDMSD